MARRFARPGKKLDFKTWAALPSVTVTGTGATTLLGGGLLFLVPATILRIRGFVNCIFDAAVQVGDAMQIGLGLAIVSDDAFNAGAGSMPDPQGDPEFPWLWWKSLELLAVSTNATAVNNTGWGMAAQRYEVDSKAMRKIHPSQTLCWIAQLTSAQGAPDTTVTLGQTRVLFGT